MATGGKVIGISWILRAAATKGSIYEFMIWSSIGATLLLIGYVLFEFVTPMFRIDREIENKNIAVGCITLFISVALATLIATCIS